jgi:hypothetical protein
MLFNSFHMHRLVSVTVAVAVVVCELPLFDRLFNSFQIHRLLSVTVAVAVVVCD